MADAWKITGSRTWCDKVVELEEHADLSIRSRDDGSFKVPLYVVPDGHVVAPRELLERLYSSDTATALMAAAELRAILYP
ncbi:restriction alleviation protein, Lar family [Pseudomonas aeruginosa]|uniref:restriction alleviation protein, Lar family n=1 Tax=Pseudomonas aeruginosa TaxID=287 RepID=UPI003CC607EA